MKLALAATVLVVNLAGFVTAQDYLFSTLVEVPVGKEYLAENLVEASGITVDRAGNLYVVEWGRHAIRKISPRGQVTTFAGKRDSYGATDGTIADARFYAGVGGLGIAADHRGNIFVADGGNHTIRKISADGEVSTVAGLAGVRGSVDGIGSAARFASPSSVAVDLTGNLFVADFENQTIRKITSDGVVSTLAGLPGARESVDGTGRGARFYSPASVAVARDGSVYVASYDNTIRKVSSLGEVTTIAGLAGSRGFADGTGSDVRFAFSMQGFPSLYLFALGVAVDGVGNVWVADPGNWLVRKITPAGTVTSHGRTTPLGFPSGIAVDAADHLYLVDGGDISRVFKGVPQSTFSLRARPRSQTLARGSTAVLTVAADGAGLMYQWKKDGVALPDATRSSLIVTLADAVDAGTYAWRVTDATGDGADGEALLGVESSESVGRVAKFSIRSAVGYRGRTLMVGATIAGSPADSMPVLLRAAGLSLIKFSPWGFVRDPSLTVSRGGTVVLRNDDWLGDALVVARAQEVGAFPLYSADSGDAAIATDLASGTYLMEVAAKGDAYGDVLAEWYDATLERQQGASSPRLVNVSAHKQIDGDGGVALTAGFAIGGRTARTVLLRAVGPSLAAVGVLNAVADPLLQLFAGPTLIRENDNWGGDPQLANVSRSVGAFALTNAGSKDAVLLATLAPGEYTLQVRTRISDSGSGGSILAEIFEVP